MDVEAFFPRQRKQLAEFIGEKCGTGRIGFAVDDRIMEGQRIQGIDDIVAAHVAAPAGFDAHDGQNDFSRHSTLGGNLFDTDTIIGEIGTALPDPAFGQENGTVLRPGPGRLRRPGHRIDDGLTVKRLGQGVTDFRFGDAVFLRRIGNELLLAGLQIRAHGLAVGRRRSWHCHRHRKRRCRGGRLLDCCTRTAGQGEGHHQHRNLFHHLGPCLLMRTNSNYHSSFAAGMPRLRLKAPQDSGHDRAGRAPRSVKAAHPWPEAPR